MKPLRIGIAGPTGYIGSHVVRAARQRGLTVRILGRGSHADLHLDLQDLTTFPDALKGLDVLLDATSRTSGTAAELDLINHQGVTMLTAVAARMGIHHVRVSTSSVHGGGLQRGVDMSEQRLAPSSDVSLSRALGDAAVLEAGGAVVRPHMVLGPGDRWIAPAVCTFLPKHGWIDGGAARHTVITSESLGRGILTLGERRLSGVFYAGDDTLTFRKIATDILEPAGLQAKSRNMTLAEAQAVQQGGDWGRYTSFAAVEHFFSLKAWRSATTPS